MSVLSKRDPYPMAPPAILEAIKEANLDIPRPNFDDKFHLFDKDRVIVEGNFIIKKDKDGKWLYAVVAKVFDNVHTGGNVFVTYDFGFIFGEQVILGEHRIGRVRFHLIEPVIPKVISVSVKDEPGQFYASHYLPVSLSVLNVLLNTSQKEKTLQENLEAEKTKVRTLVEAMNGRIP